MVLANIPRILASVTLILILLPLFGSSQDTIYMKTGETLNCKILFRDREKVKYCIPPDSTVKSLGIKSIVFIRVQDQLRYSQRKTNQDFDSSTIVGVNAIPRLNDDKAAYKLMEQGGSNLKVSGILGLSSMALGIAAAIVPLTLSSMNSDTKTTVALILGGTAGGLLIGCFAELITAGNQIRKAGLIFQYKNVQLSPTSMIIKI